MANSLYFTSLASLKPANKPGLSSGNYTGRKIEWIKEVASKGNIRSLEVKAIGSDQETKSGSIMCKSCDGNGAVSCSQCQGSGVNSVDHFNGQFKAGERCWLCGGKKDILCGDCNGAGFVGGFLSTQDE